MISWTSSAHELATVPFTALVTDTGPESLALRVFSHAASARTVRLRLWRLPPGTYRMTRRLPDGSEVSSRIDLTQRGQSIPLTLPAQTLLRVRVEKE